MYVVSKPGFQSRRWFLYSSTCPLKSRIEFLTCLFHRWYQQ
jgi:hypothetical protein